jgi:hypothetical protein
MVGAHYAFISWRSKFKPPYASVLLAANLAMANIAIAIEAFSTMQLRIFPENHSNHRRRGMPQIGRAL